MSEDLLKRELAELEKADLRRRLLTLTPLPDGYVRLADGRRLLNLCGNDYLGLALDERLARAAQAALVQYGAGAAASRLVTGNFDLHEQAEAALAALVGTPAALLVGSGWHANTGLIPALLGKNDVIFSDAANHASIIDGCRLAGAKIVIYRHNDPVDLQKKIRAHRPQFAQAAIVTESVFSMDGDQAPLREIAGLAKEHECLLLVDEAHTIGVYGRGRGLLAELGLTDVAAAIVITCGKALGGYGAAVCGSALLREKLINQARSLIFSTAPPPPSVAAAAEAARIVLQEGKPLLDRLRANVETMASVLREAGVELPEPCGPIMPLVLGENRRALQAADALAEKGLLVRPIRPPSVSPGKARLRLTVSAAHRPVDIARAAEILAGKIS